MSFLSSLGSLVSSVVGSIPGIGSIAQSGASALGSLFDQKSGYDQSLALMQKQYDYSLALQNEQNAWSESMWNKNNEYNSPSAQVQRLKAAGLNPNLAYGSLSGNVASQASAPSRNMPSVVDPSSYLVAKSVAAKTSAETNLLNAQADAARAQADKSRSDKNLVDIETSWRAALNQTNIDLAKANIGELDERKLLNKALQDYWDTARNSNYYLSRSQYFLNYKQMDYLSAQINRINYLAPAEKSVLYAQASMYGALTGLYNVQADLLEIDYRMQSYYESHGYAPTAMDMMTLTRDMYEINKNLKSKEEKYFFYKDIILPTWASVNNTIGAVGSLKGSPFMPSTVNTTSTSVSTSRNYNTNESFIYRP